MVLTPGLRPEMPTPLSRPFSSQVVFKVRTWSVEAYGMDFTSMWTR